MSEAAIFEALETVISELSELKEIRGDFGRLNDNFSNLSKDFQSLSQNQVALQQALERALLDAERMEDRSVRSDRNASESLSSVKELNGEFKLLRKTVTEFTASFNRLDLKVNQTIEAWDYRIKSIEEEALPRVYSELNEFVTLEKYNDDRQNAEIEEYRNWKARLKLIVRKFGVPIGILGTLLFRQLISQGGATEIVQFFIDLFTE